jgi:hypothetical protein
MVKPLFVARAKCVVVLNYSEMEAKVPRVSWARLMFRCGKQPIMSHGVQVRLLCRKLPMELIASMFSS